MWYAAMFTVGAITAVCGIARYMRHKEAQLIKSVLDNYPKAVLKIVKKEK